MSDVDREWKPKGRPQSTMAQQFSTALDSAFNLESGIDDLSSNVEQKKQMVTIQNWELEALERRIRETEERLSRQKNRTGSGHNSPKNEGNNPPQEGTSSDSGEAGPSFQRAQAQAQAQARSSLSSANSDPRPSDDEMMDSSTSTATSNDADHNHADKAKERA